MIRLVTSPSSASSSASSTPDQPESTPFAWRLAIGFVFVDIVLFAAIAYFALSKEEFPPWVRVVIGGSFGAIVTALGVALGERDVRRSRSREAAARTRLRVAEARLADEIVATDSTNGQESGTEVAPTPVERRREDRLALAALWEVTHSRLDLYHQIATGQARRSFFTAQVATGVGFILLIVFAIVAARTKTTAGAITTATLGAVSAALAGYIGRTFVRSQESAAEHLRAYFDQPLEFSRYLAAERLLASGPDLDSEQRARILTAVVQAILASPSPAETAQKRRQRR